MPRSLLILAFLICLPVFALRGDDAPAASDYARIVAAQNRFGWRLFRELLQQRPESVDGKALRRPLGFARS